MNEASFEQHDNEDKIRFQARLLNAVGQAVIATDLEGRIIYWNRFAEVMYGWVANEVLGQNIILITPSDLAQEQAMEIFSYLQRGEPWQGEFWVKRCDGTIFPALVIDTPIMDEAGHLVGVIGVSSDITAQKKMLADLEQYHQQLEQLVTDRTAELSQLNQQLKQNEARYRKISELISNYAYSFRLEADGRLIPEWVTGAFADITGFTPQEFNVGTAAGHLIHPDDLPIARERVQVLLTGQTDSREFRIITKTGEVRWLYDTAEPIWDEEQQRIVGIIGAARDITQRKLIEAQNRELNEELEERVFERTQTLTATHEQLWLEIEKRKLTEENLRSYQFELEMQNLELQETQEKLGALYNNYRNLYEFAPLSYFIFDTKDRIVDVNLRGTILLSRERKYLLMKPFTAYVVPEHQAEFRRHCREVLAERVIQNCEINIVTQVGLVINVQLQSMADQDDSGKFTHIRTAMIDITIRKKAESEMRYLALHDALTHLPNRTLFDEILRNLFNQSKQSPYTLFAILLLDCDRFKLVNDSLGHLLGDQVLVMVAERLQSCLPSTATLARFEGDEFIILLPNITNLVEAVQLASQIEQSFSSSFHLQESELFVNFSIGIAPNQPFYEQPEHIVRDANMAMYQAKKLGKGRYYIFDRTMHARALTLLRLETDLRQALNRHQFLLYYQPIINLATEQVMGFEALIRWQHPQRGLLTPSEFMSFVEETGLILPLGQWVLAEACRQLKTWLAQFNQPLSMSINLSVAQFIQPQFLSQLYAIFEEMNLEPAQVHLEVTESAIIEDSQKALALLQELKSYRVGLSIDDFGTGYSALNYLYQFPFDTLKIDRSFINQIQASPKSWKIVQAIVNLAHNLGLKVVGEGIASAEQYALLRELGCEFGQGYWFSKPLPAKTATLFLKQHFEK